jgi:hypothetical protein
MTFAPVFAVNVAAMLRKAAAPVSSDQVSKRSVLPEKLCSCARRLMNGIGNVDAASAAPIALMACLLPRLISCMAVSCVERLLPGDISL